MGLLDLKYEDVMSNPLLQMGLGVMANNQGHGGAFMPAFGGGVQQGMANLAQYQDQLRRKQLQDQQIQMQKQQFDMQKSEWDQKQKEFANRQTGLDMLTKGMNPHFVGPYADVNQAVQPTDLNMARQGLLMVAPDEIAKQAYKTLFPEQKPVKIGFSPNGVAYNENDPTNLILGQNYAKPEDNKPVNGYMVPDGAGGWKIDSVLYDAEKGLKKAGATNVSVNQGYEKEFQKNIAKLDSEQLSKWRNNAQSAVGLVNTLDRLEKISPNTYSGGLANEKMAAVNFISGLTGADPKKLANSQEYESLATQLVLDKLGGSLGTGVSNADVAFIKNTVPQLGHSLEARKNLMSFLRGKAQNQVDLFEKADSYARENNGLKGFKHPAMYDQAPKQESTAPSLNASAVPVPMRNGKIDQLNLKAGQMYEGLGVWNPKTRHFE